MTPVFLTGMFRSGTTTVARALNAHPAVAFSSDPFLEFFKVLRSELAKDLGQEIPYKNPLEDYYFSQDGVNLLRAIENASFDRKWNYVDWDELVPVLKKRCRAYSADLEDHIDKITGETYKQILESLLEQVVGCYGKEGNTHIVGFKEVWATEFIPAFLNNMPGSKAIVMQRDPRAVCASKNVTEEKYPWLFLARQWRKLAALGWAYAHDPVMKDRIYLLSFEDFVCDPERITREICDFLEIDWHPDFADPGAYKGGDGAPWKQNTSYGGGQSSFNKQSVEKWRTALSEEEIRFIEFLCGPEMKLFGYEPVFEENAMAAENMPRVDDAAQAEWMKSLVPNDRETLAAEMEKELMRNSLLSDLGKGEVLTPEKTALINKAFLHEDVYEALCENAPVVIPDDLSAEAFTGAG